MLYKTESCDFNRPEFFLGQDLIVYEYDANFSNLIHPFLSEQPESLLLAIDLHYNQALVFDCQPRPAHSMQELCELIKEEAQNCAQRKEAF